MNKKALVIFSGGQDSTTCLYWAIDKWGYENVQAVTFNYGQRHEIELLCAENICRYESIRQTIVDVSFLKEIVDSHMVSGQNVEGVNEKELPNSFVPNRNQLFITLSHALAQKLKVGNLVAGMCETDYSGYPDCREKFIVSLQEVTNLGSQSEIVIHTPLMHKTKAQTFELAANLDRLSEILSMSHTCYNGDRSAYREWGYGCGECAACKLRIKGWEEYKAGFV